MKQQGCVSATSIHAVAVTRKNVLFTDHANYIPKYCPDESSVRVAAGGGEALVAEGFLDEASRGAAVDHAGMVPPVCRDALFQTAIFYKSFYLL